MGAFPSDLPADTCSCGAVRVDYQLGLEKTPAEYVAKLVAGFREVRRVLRDDGVLFLNLGDCYCSTDKWGGDKNGNTGKHTVADSGEVPSWTCRAKRESIPGLKPKDLVGIPWMVAFALRDDGWYLRSDIIWAKPNPMPESVTDRPTKSHEYIFLLSKRTTYFYDAEAIKEPFSDERNGDPGAYQRTTAAAKGARNDRQDLGFSNEGKGWNTSGDKSGRNKRTVWTVPSQAYPESHFATFPEDLIKPCILAGTSAKGCCPKCGAPWERVLGEAKGGTIGASWHDHADDSGMGQRQKHVGEAAFRTYRPAKTLGWQPTCKCGERTTVPCVVCDPFAGSGTTGQVALELGRNAILIELNPKYIELIRQRTNVTPGLPLV